MYKFATWHNLSVLSVLKIVMEKTTEQPIAIRFFWKAGFNATKTFEVIQKVYGESAVHRATVFCWYNAFSEGWQLVRDEQRCGRPMTTRTCKNIARVADILKEDRRSSCRLIAEWTGISKTNATNFVRRFITNGNSACGLCHIHWQPNRKNSI